MKLFFWYDHVMAPNEKTSHNRKGTTEESPGTQCSSLLARLAKRPLKPGSLTAGRTRAH